MSLSYFLFLGHGPNISVLEFWAFRKVKRAARYWLQNANIGIKIGNLAVNCFLLVLEAYFLDAMRVSCWGKTGIHKAHEMLLQWFILV